MAYRKYDRDGFCVEPMTTQAIETAAFETRKFFYPDGQNLLDVMDLIEHKLPLAYQSFHLDVVRPEELPGREAEFNPTNFCIRIREPIYEAACNYDGHCRFTVAHELGHFFLHRDQTPAFGRPARDGKIPAYKHSEWQADTFARNLLAPRQLTNGMTVPEIKTVFEVSYEVACIVAGEQIKPVYTPHPTQLNLGI